MIDFADRDDRRRRSATTSATSNVTFRMGERVTSVQEHGAETLTTLASGKQIAAEAVFYSAGRQGATDALELENVRPLGRRARPDRGRPELPDGRRAHLGRRAT